MNGLQEAPHEMKIQLPSEASLFGLKEGKAKALIKNVRGIVKGRVYYEETEKEEEKKSISIFTTVGWSEVKPTLEKWSKALGEFEEDVKKMKLSSQELLLVKTQLSLH